jgi:C4-type Zn-finger protein
MAWFAAELNSIQWMAKYLARSCPRCDGYLGIVLPEPRRNIRLQAINGRCAECGYRMAWVLVRGRKSALRIGTLVVHHAKTLFCVAAWQEKGGSQ